MIFAIELEIVWGVTSYYYYINQFKVLESALILWGVFFVVFVVGSGCLRFFCFGLGVLLGFFCNDYGLLHRSGFLRTYCAVLPVKHIPS